VGSGCWHKNERARGNVLVMHPVEKATCPLSHKVEFITARGLLGIVTLRLIELHIEGTTVKDWHGEVPGGWRTQPQGFGQAKLNHWFRMCLGRHNLLFHLVSGVALQQ
jgi:hypothetical protein